METLYRFLISRKSCKLQICPNQPNEIIADGKSRFTLTKKLSIHDLENWCLFQNKNGNFPSVMIFESCNI